MGAQESTYKATDKPTENARCSCPEPHRGDNLQKTQKGLNTEPEFDSHRVRSDLIELANNLRTLSFGSVMGTEQAECSTRKSYPLGPDGKPLKPCCACPETKRNRDACIIEKGEENCSELIEAHKACMRSLGFNI